MNGVGCGADTQIPIYINTNEEYTYEEVKEEVKEYITLDKLNECLKDITKYTKDQINFIKYLSILNKSLSNEFKQFEYNILLYNNIFPVTASYNSEYRRLLGYNENGEQNNINVIMNLAKEMTNLVIQISYARENIKTLIQQYTFIRY